MNAHRTTILVDVDEVLFPFAHAYHEWLVRERGRGLDPELMRQYEIASAAGDGHREHAVCFVNDPATLDVEPVPGAAAAIQLLTDSFRVVACTTRLSETEGPATRAWLDRHLPGFDELVCTRERHDSASMAKSVVAVQFQAIALIDDTEANLGGLPEYCTGMLLRRPTGLDSHVSAMTWHEALKQLRP